MEEQNLLVNEGYGSIRIADEVVAVIAGIAATNIEGIAGMSGGVAGGIAEMIGRKNLSKGVKVSVGETETAIDIYIIVEYGVKIPEVTKNIQDEVKQSVENMTGLSVVEVNVHVVGVKVEDDKNEGGSEQLKLK
ncbi:Asp23/Gls24 family envelope stress response protein [Proteinivorax hydrogeniformans]|uniref:Asp23/Gls24 family envelope stress response protein n=1 Tax=Proteinivorax hydrogeniformans TaxID=1826727 RepID=A0AAU8HQJ6_9FIRM